MNKLKVVMVADYPVGGERIDGGVQAVSSYIVSGLKAIKDIDLSIVSFRSGLAEPTKVQEGDIPVYLLPRAPMGNVTFYRRDLRCFLECLHKIQPDLVHSQGATVEGYLSAKSGYPCVITFHGIIGEDAKYKSTFRERLRFKLISWIAERYCVRSRCYKILISPYVQRYYGKQLKGVCRDISNPIKADFYTLDGHKESGRILFAGKLIRRKGVLNLIKALGLLDRAIDFHLVIAGALDDEAYVKEIRDEMAILGIEDRVTLLGLIDEKQVLEEFSKASILVLPSYQETAPMVIQQAMAARVAVLATQICGVPDQLDQGALGLMYHPDDLVTCARHLRRLLTDTAFRDSLVENAYAKALRDFHVDAVVKSTVALYREVLAT